MRSWIHLQTLRTTAEFSKKMHQSSWCYLKENFSQEKISWKNKSFLKQTKCWKALSLESKCRQTGTRWKETRQADIETYKKSLIAKSAQNDAKKREKERKEPVFLNWTNTPIVTFRRSQIFFPAPLFCLFKNKMFVKLTHFRKRPKRENIIKEK